ncbi:MAG: hypothetical protein R3229_06930 [Alphaproteobacteria bacterium]|nr:hypothetical protein [Alphaproteobacteria bacterium]
MNFKDLSPFDQVIVTLYGDVWRESPIFGAPLREPHPERRLRDEKNGSDR